jgi:superoxide oxidase
VRLDVHAPLPRWQLRLDSGVHVAPCALMVVRPIPGWLVPGAAGRPMPLFGFRVPGGLAENKGLAVPQEDVHGTIAPPGHFFIGAQALAALFHHFFTGDNTPAAHAAAATLAQPWSRPYGTRQTPSP